MRIGIIIIGDEILSGRRQDKHFGRCVQLLAARQLALDWAFFVGDEPASLTAQLRLARGSGHLCFTFGGIGATPDDFTRQCMAEAHDLPLARHPGALALIEEQFGAAAYPSRVLMADLPQGAELIPNPVNRVPGFGVGHIHCLPGFPQMAWPMLEWVLDQRYPRLMATKPTELSVVLSGVPESELIPWMNAFLQRHPGVKLFSLPHLRPDGGRELELGVKGERAAAEAAYAELRAMVAERGYGVL